MEIKNVMTQDVVRATADATVDEVAKKMRNADCGIIPIEKEDRLIGVITDRDIALRCVAEGLDPKKTTADQIMTPKVLYCYETDDVKDTAQNMAENKVRRLIVLNEKKRLVGIVSLDDIAVFGKDFSVIGEALADICAHGASTMQGGARH